MKRKLFTAGMVIALLFLAACNKNPGTTVTPTVNPTEAPAPTNTTAPTATPVPTTEPTVAPTLEPTATVAPTEAPHEHTWEAKEEKATCSTEGKTWEACECGAVRNEVFFEKTAHEKTTYKVVTEATTEADGAYEMVCDACGAVVESGKINMIETVATPTPLPTSTPTPVPTSTPTPLPTNTPTPTPECEHENVESVEVKQTDAEIFYKQVCEDCGMKINEYTVAKATPTPTATPIPTATPTPRPTATPTPVPDFGKVIAEYKDPNSANRTIIDYADGTQVITNSKNNLIMTNYPDGTKVADYSAMDKYVADGYVYYKEYYANGELDTGDEYLNGFWVNHDWVATEYVQMCEETTQHDEVIYYYVYYYEDRVNDTITSYIVNSDGSKNKFSEHIFYGEAVAIESTRYGRASVEDIINNVWTLTYVQLRAGALGEEQQKVSITPEEFYLYDKKNKIIHLFEY